MRDLRPRTHNNFDNALRALDEAKNTVSNFEWKRRAFYRPINIKHNYHFIYNAGFR